MLSPTPDPLRIALNRVTFGARDVDVLNARNMGWPAWVADQLSAPAGDDPQLDAHLKAQTMRINYSAPTENQPQGTWVATDEIRPLNYLNADTPTLWNIARHGGSTFSFSERTRISQELAAATWIRNTHSKFQVREFMVDFWHNHFNIGKNENALATALFPVYDRTAIRPFALGNFRAMLEANATSSSMLLYLDNSVSTATTPNENYAREIMELHTLGGGAYYGTAAPADVPKGSDGIAVGFTDQDIVQASRVLSGWTVQNGQRLSNTQSLPDTGEFIFNLGQHNRNAGVLLGFNMGTLTNIDLTQGRWFLDIIAAHPSTAKFIVTKLAKRIFGDTPPQTVIDRGVAAWKTYRTAPDQIAQVLRAILLDGDEVTTAQVAKVRRPYERIIALARTTDMVVNAATFMTTMLDPLNDGLFSWPAPNGRPDANSYWLATGAMLTTWNDLFLIPNAAEFSSKRLTDQSPSDAMTTATGIVEYWVNRMVGYQLSMPATQGLVSDQAGSNGVPALARARTVSATALENAHRRLVSLIATTEEFSLR